MVQTWMCVSLWIFNCWMHVVGRAWMRKGARVIKRWSIRNSAEDKEGYDIVEIPITKTSRIGLCFTNDRPPLLTGSEDKRAEMIKS